MRAREHEKARNSNANQLVVVKVEMSSHQRRLTVSIKGIPNGFP